MKFCKRETFLYWSVHCLIWIVIALPMVTFILRISHPKHESSTKLNETSDVEQTRLNRHEGCTNTESNCQLIETLNGSVDTRLGHDEEIRQLLDGDFFAAYHSTCSTLLQKVLYLQKCIKCTLFNKTHPWRMSSHLINVSHEFCKNCPVNTSIRMNTSLVGRYKWLENLACISFDELFKENYTKNETDSPGKNATCSDPLVKDENGTCRIPCDWSLMSSKLRDTYYGVMVLNMWAAIIAALITIGTLASFKLMRTFPHIVRFYILICSVLYATASLLPLRIGLAKVYCGTEKFWNEDGHTSKPTVLEGAITHYFFLTFCFWSCCYVTNTYSVIVNDAQNIFVHKTKYHAIQFVLCSTLPALLVGINMAIKPPGYKSLFLDRMTSVFTSSLLEYMTFTLPIQLTLGIAISLLWSMIHFVRKVRKNKSTLQAIRLDDDSAAFLNAEKQFTKLALLFVITVAVVLSSEVLITYQNEEYIHEVEEYFQCLKISANCPKPEAKIFFLSSVKVSGPGLFCLLNFFLLFFNKDTRDVWKKWLTWIGDKVTSKGNKRSSNDSSAAVKSPENGPQRSRSATTETIASVNSLSVVNKFEITPDYFEPADMTQLQMRMSSYQTRSMETSASKPEFTPPRDGEYLTPPTFLRTLSNENTSDEKNI